MKSLTLFSAAAMSAVAVAALTANSAQAQLRGPVNFPQPQSQGPAPTPQPRVTTLNVLPNTAALPNPNWYVAPGLRLPQWQYNTTVYGRTMWEIPPWMTGYQWPIGWSPWWAPPESRSFPSGPFTMPGTSISINSPNGNGGVAPPPRVAPGGGDPFAGRLSGATLVIAPQGNFLPQQEPARLPREQSRPIETDPRLRILQNWSYERSLPTSQPAPREQERRQALHRALNDATLPDILSASALNEILEGLKLAQALGAEGPSQSLDEQVLRRINVTAAEKGNAGLLRNGGRLTWPQALLGAEFEAERKQFEALLPEAIRQVQSVGQVDHALLRRLQTDTGNLHEKLGAALRQHLSPSQYIQAKTYLTYLDQALTVLQQPDVVNYFNQRYTARGRTVAELVKYLADNGLRFASATPGDESSYRALYQRLREYAMALGPQARN